MKNHTFIERLKEATNQKTAYMWGTFGQPVTAALIKTKARQYPSYYTSTKQAHLGTLAGRATAFDCVGLIKGILWGYNATTAPKYCSNGVPDISADQMIKVCKNVSSDFGNVRKGAAVWLPGHIGVYIGDGMVIESTPAWADGVQITKLSSRAWKAHGELPWVDYNDGGIRLVVNGIDIKAEIQNGVTVASVRSVAEALGAEVTWDEETRTVYAEGR